MNIMLLITFASPNLLIYYLFFIKKPEIFPIVLLVLLTLACLKIKPKLLLTLWILSVIPPIKLFCAGLKELILAKGTEGARRAHSLRAPKVPTGAFAKGTEGADGRIR
jgi:hypothetical protein